jgi:hypothetical protein
MVTMGIGDPIAYLKGNIGHKDALGLALLSPRREE